VTRKAQAKQGPERLRSAYLIAEGSPTYGNPPFRQSFLMLFPPEISVP
jgi:hypothetical protein